MPWQPKMGENAIFSFFCITDFLFTLTIRQNGKNSDNIHGNMYAGFAHHGEWPFGHEM